MPHPGLQGFEGDTRIVAPGAEIHAEVMAADGDAAPWREILSHRQERFVLLRLSKNLQEVSEGPQRL